MFSLRSDQAQRREARRQGLKELRIRRLGQKERSGKRLTDEEESFLDQFGYATLGRAGFFDSDDEVLFDDESKATGKFSFDDSDDERKSSALVKRRKTIADDESDGKQSSAVIRPPLASLDPNGMEPAALGSDSSPALGKSSNTYGSTPLGKPSLSKLANAKANAKANGARALGYGYEAKAKSSTRAGYGSGSESEDDSSDDDFAIVKKAPGRASSKPSAQSLVAKAKSSTRAGYGSGSESEDDSSDDELVEAPLTLRQQDEAKMVTFKQSNAKRITSELKSALKNVTTPGHPTAWAGQYVNSERLFFFGTENKGGSALVPTPTPGKFVALNAMGYRGKGEYDYTGKSFARKQASREACLNRTGPLRGMYIAQKTVYGNVPQILYETSESREDQRCRFLNEAQDVRAMLIKAMRITADDRGCVISGAFATSDTLRRNYSSINEFCIKLRRIGASIIILDSDNNVVTIKSGEGRNYKDDDTIVMIHECFFRGNGAICARITEQR